MPPADVYDMLLVAQHAAHGADYDARRARSTTDAAERLARIRAAAQGYAMAAGRYRAAAMLLTTEAPVGAEGTT